MTIGVVTKNGIDRQKMAWIVYGTEIGLSDTRISLELFRVIIDTLLLSLEVLIFTFGFVCRAAGKCTRFNLK